MEDQQSSLAQASKQPVCAQNNIVKPAIKSPYARNTSKLDTKANDDETAAQYQAPIKIMHQQGAAGIQQTGTYKTPVSIKFEVGKQERSFPIRKKLADLFQRIKRIDEHACLTESLGDRVWSDMEDLP
eukprot:3241656-Ditylum_brightwellii.AAC.1